jgi:hypothetical protein
LIIFVWGVVVAVGLLEPALVVLVVLERQQGFRYLPERLTQLRLVQEALDQH